MRSCLLALAAAVGTSSGTASAQFTLVQPFSPAPLRTPPLFTPPTPGGGTASPFGPARPGGPTGFTMAQQGSPLGYRGAPPAAPGASGFTILQDPRPSNSYCGSAWESYYRHRGWGR